MPAQVSLLPNSLRFTGALEKGTRNTALDNLGTVNEWKNILSYTAGWRLAGMGALTPLWQRIQLATGLLLSSGRAGSGPRCQLEFGYEHRPFKAV